MSIGAATIAGCYDGGPGDDPTPLTEPANGCEDGSDPVPKHADNDNDGRGGKVIGHQCPDDASQIGGIDVGGDCDDDDETVYGPWALTDPALPAAVDICDGKDNDCNGVKDDGQNKTWFYQDADADGVGVSSQQTDTQACQQPSGYAAEAGDCDDTDAQVSPKKTEVCDGIDNDCDLEVDEPGAAGEQTYYYDEDKDGFGDTETILTSCSQPSDYVQKGGDCNDDNPAINPDAAEVCGNAKDDDCDGETDEDFDADEDGYATCGDAPDCNDNDPDIKPGATEICDGVDNDCDGKADEDFDVDGDGAVAEAHAGQCATGIPVDCDDTDGSVHPYANESCDGKDNDCDGVKDDGFDNDADGYTVCGAGGKKPDCNDTDRNTYPGAFEACDGIDQNCDGKVDDEHDNDADGYRECAGDCDDADAAVKPGATELCDGKDNDCDGLSDKNEGFDNDNDGYTVCQSPIADCNDGDRNINPGAAEICNGVDDDCDTVVDENNTDADGDGYWVCADNDCDDTDANINPDATEVCDSKDNNCDGQIDEGLSCLLGPKLKPSWLFEPPPDEPMSQLPEPWLISSSRRHYAADTASL